MWNHLLCPHNSPLLEGFPLNLQRVFIKKKRDAALCLEAEFQEKIRDIHHRMVHDALNAVRFGPIVEFTKYLLCLYKGEA
ncbi:MAG: hypothetical protein ACI97A_001455 [Planctomycetota bacterium]|jgi:hypothetical protein